MAAVFFDLVALKAQIDALKLGVTVSEASFGLGRESYLGLCIDLDGKSVDESARVWFYNNHVGGMFYSGKIKRGDAGYFLPVSGLLAQDGTFANAATARAFVGVLTG